MPKYAKGMNEMPPGYLLCRTYGHVWAHSTDTEFVQGHQEQIIQFTEHTVCVRCRAERRRVISVPSFDVVTSSVRYRDGYLFAKGRAPKSGRKAALSERFDRMLR